VRASAHEGRTWSGRRQLHAGPSACSGLVSLAATEAGGLYGRGTQRAYEKIAFVRFAVK
jgi:hypothetical protein